jgi:hypothetical protein
MPRGEQTVTAQSDVHPRADDAIPAASPMRQSILGPLSVVWLVCAPRVYRPLVQAHGKSERCGYWCG